LSNWKYFWTEAIPTFFGAIWDLIKWIVLDFLFIDEVVHWAIGFLEPSFKPIWDAIRNFGLMVADIAVFLWNGIGDLLRPIFEFITEVIAILVDGEGNKIV
jgi:hypothetical protein